MKNTDNLMMSQSISNRKLSTIIAIGCGKRLSRGWGQQDNLSSLFKFIDVEKSHGRHLLSVAVADDFGFGMFTLGGYGTDQIISNNVDDIDLLWKKDFQITAVWAWGLDFYFAMTKGAKEYAGKFQTYYISSSWTSLEDKIKRGWTNGLVITGVCFSAKVEKYLLVLTESGARQKCMWDLTSNCLNHKDCKGYHPTAVFHDLRSDRVLTVITKGKVESEAQIRFKLLLKSVPV